MPYVTGAYSLVSSVSVSANMHIASCHSTTTSICFLKADPFGKAIKQTMWIVADPPSMLVQVGLEVCLLSSFATQNSPDVVIGTVHDVYAVKHGWVVFRVYIPDLPKGHDTIHSLIFLCIPQKWTLLHPIRRILCWLFQPWPLSDYICPSQLTLVSQVLQQTPGYRAVAYNAGPLLTLDDINDLV